MGYIVSSSVIELCPLTLIHLPHALHSVGAVAKEIYPSNPQNTVFDLMRLLGRPFSEIRDQAQDWPFDVIEHAGLAMIVIYGYQGNRQYVPPEEVLALLLVDLYLAAQRRFGIQPDTVFEATLALPPHLSSKQRELVLNAAEMAGLKIIGCVEEPIASAIAYRYEHQSGLVSEDLSQAKGDLLVYDFGGGALDVSVVGMSDVSAFDLAIVTRHDGHTKVPGGQGCNHDSKLRRIDHRRCTRPEYTRSLSPTGIHRKGPADRPARPLGTATSCRGCENQSISWIAGYCGGAISLWPGNVHSYFDSV